MAVELERSYVFSPESIPYILDFLSTSVVGNPHNIVDNYLNSSLRIRNIAKQRFILTRKIGDKSSGQRIEEEQTINQRTATILASDSKLQIVKKRYCIFHTSKTFNITLDIFEAPMKIAVLEIESTNGEMPPTASQVFGRDLHECPLATWDFFRQKIGICGAPSSGKTETAKVISHMMNTRLCANSFHVLEYATSFIQKYDRHPNAMDQFMLWYSQWAREENAASKANIVISDCPTFLSYVYMVFNNKEKMDIQFMTHLAKLYKRVLEDVDSYSRIIYLRPKDLVKNNIRFHDTKDIHEIANRIYSFLNWHNIPYIIAEHGDERRIVDSLFFMNKTGKETIMMTERWKDI